MGKLAVIPEMQLRDLRSHFAVGEEREGKERRDKERTEKMGKHPWSRPSFRCNYAAISDGLQV